MKKLRNEEKRKKKKEAREYRERDNKVYNRDYLVPGKHTALSLRYIRKILSGE